MSSKGNQKSSRRLTRIITKPIRFLIKAKDNYVKSMNNLADAANYSNFMGLPAGAMPRSFSVSSSNYEDEDLRELITSSSVNNTKSVMDLYMIKQQEMKKKKKKKKKKKPSSTSGAVMKIGSRRVPRSFSVGMEKIDEEIPCDDFGEEDLNNHLGTKATEFMYPRSRSRSYAVVF